MITEAPSMSSLAENLMNFRKEKIPYQVNVVLLIQVTNRQLNLVTHKKVSQEVNLC